ncbi:MAG: AhpC/TSA family protein [Prevotella sp.]|nr:AhpC/TSA family protein [Prevotella sp.]MDD7461075.1 TlpA disulfide reductase family protein [Prevotellaceae bacterium]MDY3366191.1 TlpA disulfide reductase family protein [Prevotella sp.]
MRKMFYSCLATGMLLMSSAAHAADGELRVKGNLKNFGDTAIVFVSSPGSRDTRPDTFLIKKGKFDFKVTAKRVSNMVITPLFLRHQDEARTIRLVAVPGETVELNGDMKTRYDVNGTGFYKQMNAVSLMMEEAGKPIRELNEGLNKRLAAGESRDSLVKEYNEKAPVLAQKMEADLMNFIKNNPKSEAAVTVVTQFESLEQMEEALSHLSTEVKEGRMKPYYSHFLNTLKTQKEESERNARKQAAGTVAPDFTLNDINGKPLSLSSLQGKYVVLDFWGTWCVWCIKGFPEMKAYYEKYKDKLEILGVDCGDTEDKWKAGVKEHQLPWLNVYNPRNSSVLADYGVKGFPTKILIGPDGKIVKTIVGESPAFYTLLDELFGGK